MAISKAYIDQLRDRLSIAEVVGKRLDWDQRKSNPARGDYWACCPFHGEKSPSFHVDDRKGYYYCFGCQEKGDALGFVMKLDNLAFHETIELLARDAGMPPPENDPIARKREEQRSGLVEAMEAAQSFFVMQLGSSAAREARAYLERRALRPDIIERFGLGYAPAQSGALSAFLKDKGFDRAILLEAGLIGRREDGSEYDRFRDRIQFPIRDPKGRVIAFGGRAMSDQAQAKYLNSPETPLFSKGRTLFNFGPARMAAGKGQPLIVAEGYMDVIALAQAGFEAAVAPLGTALTEEQLTLLWRVADEPVMALDGDSAGQRAADRAARLALPRLEPGKTLRFALMPDGVDPDDLIRASGAEAMRALIDSAEALSAFIWRHETDSRPLDTPERRADFDQRIRAVIDTISNPDVRSHYRDDFRDRRTVLFPRKGGGGGNAGQSKPWNPREFRNAAPAPPREETRRSGLAIPQSGSPAAVLEEAILRLALSAPDELSACCDSLAATEFANRTLDSIRGALISAIFDMADRETGIKMAVLHDEIGRRLPPERRVALTELCGSISYGGDKSALPAALARYHAIKAREAERRDASERFETAQDNGVVDRLMSAKSAYDTELQRVVPVVTAEEEASVQSFIDQESWRKTGRPSRHFHGSGSGPQPGVTTREKDGR